MLTPLQLQLTVPFISFLFSVLLLLLFLSPRPSYHPCSRCALGGEENISGKCLIVLVLSLSDHLTSLIRHKRWPH